MDWLWCTINDTNAPISRSVRVRVKKLDFQFRSMARSSDPQDSNEKILVIRTALDISRNSNNNDGMEEEHSHVPILLVSIVNATLDSRSVTHPFAC